MKIAGIQKLSLLDYPGRACLTVFTPGCNFRCPFCQNGGLAEGYETSRIPESEVFELLKKRRGLLDGVCVTGGEPLLQPGLSDFLHQIKSMGFKVKLDTNGFLPDRLEELVGSGLVDMTAMDIKNSPEKYALTAGVNNLNLEKIKRSASFIRSCGIEYEFRTTVVRELHTQEDIRRIGEWLAGSERYYLQQFIDSDNVLKRGLHAYSKEEMQGLADSVKDCFKICSIRGV